MGGNVIAIAIPNSYMHLKKQSLNPRIVDTCPSHPRCGILAARPYSVKMAPPGFIYKIATMPSGSTLADAAKVFDVPIALMQYANLVGDAMPEPTFPYDDPEHIRVPQARSRVHLRPACFIDLRSSDASMGINYNFICLRTLISAQSPSRMFLPCRRSPAAVSR